ncbi:hypothetical protein D9758_003294 [Tetrapyrgos nigripes]|uniref:Nuclear speckle splicing regulatory protein 1 N-terminal domain-containing protein n=1 Tax=Tetrapyrgos nigripes TaxID=182062 RepID=A0A8H5GIJ4_9AGAR|nr:hypothetical protein D9758_003294 [Tetrapyrgos nigripes]
MKLSFSLKAKPAPAQAPLKQPAAFASLDDEETTDVAPTSSTDRDASANKKLLAQNVTISNKMKKRMEAEKTVDESVYEYDEVWDKMQEAKQRQKEAKELDAKERKPKYIHGLLASAATRRLDHLRAEEKMMQKQREAEGDEFADKEAFVTQAYKDQMEEVRKAEEEERRREEEQKKNGGRSTGLAHFYRQLLEESEQSHEATVAATQKPVIGPQPNLTITKPPNFSPKTDLELARIARAEGKEVELNDDNQIVDKRELLAAGLNLSGTNTRNLKMRLEADKSQQASEVVQSHRAAGTAASRREINERRNREIREQMEEERERVARDKEREEREAIERTVAKRNKEEDIQSARERYLQRKRRKLEVEVSAAQ